jgi:hypothetical protein
VRLAAPDRIGYREEDTDIERNIKERRAIEDQELLRYKTELLLRDKRIKPSEDLPERKGIHEGQEEE